LNKRELGCVGRSRKGEVCDSDDLSLPTRPGLEGAEVSWLVLLRAASQHPTRYVRVYRPL
jgi:hypothetical protein